MNTKFKFNYCHNGREKVEKLVDLNKNQHKMGNEVIKVFQTPTFVPNSYGDRFIPRRCNINYSDQNFIRPIVINGSDYRDNDILFLKNCNGFWRQYAIKNCLETKFKDSRATVLLFHDYLTKETLKKSLDKSLNFYQYELMSNKIDKLDWPCLPRRKAVAVTEISHVLTNYSHYSDLNIISWSSSYMAASFGADLVLWIPKGKTLLTYELDGITCLAYNCDGSYLATGIKLTARKPAEIQIWDLSNNIDSVGILITSFTYPDVEDEVRSVIWDSENNYLITGMLNGNIYVFKCGPKLKVARKFTVSDHCVKILQLSSNETFLAASDDDGNVFVWNFNTFEIVFKWEEKDSTALIAWHPWEESYLIISETLPASICLVDIRIKTTIAHYKRRDDLCRINAVSFNPKSAELVVSVTLYIDDSITHEILVLAALDRVVDLLNMHDGRVKSLIWNPNGDMLATAGNDNMLNIWNFFGHSEYEPAKSNSKPKCVISKLLLGNPSLLR